jgi:hypothetical protein
MESDGRMTMTAARITAHPTLNLPYEDPQLLLPADAARSHEPQSRYWRRSYEDQRLRKPLYDFGPNIEVTVEDRGLDVYDRFTTSHPRVR